MIQAAITPEQCPFLVVNGQSVRPCDVSINQDLAVLTVHPGPGDQRHLTPVSPVHVPDKTRRRLPI